MALVSVTYYLVAVILEFLPLYVFCTLPQVHDFIEWITKVKKVKRMKQEHKAMLREHKMTVERMKGAQGELAAELKLLSKENERLNAQLDQAIHSAATVYNALTLPRIPIADQEKSICSFSCSNTHQPVLAVLRDEHLIDITTVDATQGYCRSSCLDCVSTCQRELRAKGYTQQFAMGDVWVPENHQPVHELTGDPLAFRVCPHLKSTMYVVWDKITQTIEICSYDVSHGWRRSVCVDCVVSGQKSVREMGMEQPFGVGEIWREYEVPVEQEEPEEFDEDEGVADIDDEEDGMELPRLVEQHQQRDIEPIAEQIVEEPELPEEWEVTDGLDGPAPVPAEHDVEYELI